jgi:hypothetical protein
MPTGALILAGSVSHESIAPKLFTVPPVKIDGISPAITTDVVTANDLPDPNGNRLRQTMDTRSDRFRGGASSAVGQRRPG